MSTRLLSKRGALPALWLAAGFVVSGCASDAPAGLDHSGEPVAAVRVTAAQTVVAGTTLQVHAVAYCTHGALQAEPMTWGVDDADKGVIDAHGMLSAIHHGTISVTAAARGVSGSTQVTILPSLRSVTLEPDGAVLDIGDVVDFGTAIVDYRGDRVLDLDVTWRTSDPAMLHVDGDGVVTALAAGEVTVEAQVAGVVATALVVVRAPLPGLRFMTRDVTLYLRETKELVAVLFDTDGKAMDRPVAWSSTRPDIAPVDGNGIVTGAAVGRTTVYASADGFTATTTVTVMGRIATMLIEPNVVAMTPGSKAALRVLLWDETGTAVSTADRPVVWNVEDVGVVKMIDPGLLLGVAEGETFVTATAEGTSMQARVTVRKAVSPAVAIVVTPDIADPAVGEQEQFTATYVDAGGAAVTGGPITWASSDETVATVDDTGLVIVIGWGEAWIIASGDGLSGAARIMPPGMYLVTRIDVDPVDGGTLAVDETMLCTAVPMNMYDMPTADPVAWRMSNPAIAAVDDVGNVTGVSPGETDLFISAGGVVVSIPVVVTPAAP